jgi:hypothetical protein
MNMKMWIAKANAAAIRSTTARKYAEKMRRLMEKFEQEAREAASAKARANARLIRYRNQKVKAEEMLANSVRSKNSTYSVLQAAKSAQRRAYYSFVNQKKATFRAIRDSKVAAKLRRIAERNVRTEYNALIVRIAKRVAAAKDAANDATKIAVKARLAAEEAAREAIKAYNRRITVTRVQKARTHKQIIQLQISTSKARALAK